MPYNDQPPECHMDTGAQMLETWTDKLGDSLVRLQALLDDLIKMQAEMGGGATIAKEANLIAAIDLPFLQRLFDQVDVNVVVHALDRAGEESIIKFFEAALYLVAHRRLSEVAICRAQKVLEDDTLEALYRGFEDLMKRRRLF